MKDIVGLQSVTLIEIDETSSGSNVYTISVHLSNRDGRAVNTFKRTINAN